MEYYSNTVSNMNTSHNYNNMYNMNKNNLNIPSSQQMIITNPNPNNQSNNSANFLYNFSSEGGVFNQDPNMMKSKTKLNTQTMNNNSNFFFNNNPSNYNQNSTSGYPNSNFSSISKLISQLQEETSKETHELEILKNQIDQRDNLILELIQTHSDLTSELVEKKVRSSLIKKEIEVRKNYLNSLIKTNKMKSEKCLVVLMSRLEMTVGRINNLVNQSNLVTQEFKAEYLVVEEETLSVLEEVDFTVMNRILKS